MAAAAPLLLLALGGRHATRRASASERRLSGSLGGEPVQCGRALPESDVDIRPTPISELQKTVRSFTPNAQKLGLKLGQGSSCAVE